MATKSSKDFVSKKFIDWWFPSFEIHSMGLMRVGLGLVFFVSYLSFLSDFETIYGSSGVNFFTNPRALALLSIPPGFVYAALLVSAALFALGVGVHLFGVCLILCNCYFLYANPAHDFGWSRMANFFVVYYLAFERRRGFLLKWVPPTQARVFFRLAQIHLCAIYFAAAWNRIDNETWVSGQLLYMALNNDVISRVAAMSWESVRGLLSYVIHGVWAMEFLAPVLLWTRWSAKVAAALIIMHLLFEAFLTVGAWQFFMICILVNFLPQDFCKKIQILFFGFWSRIYFFVKGQSRRVVWNRG